MKPPPVLEPFVEPIRATSNLGGADSYRIGYRIAQDGSSIASITVPAELIGKALISGVSLTLAATPNGQVKAVLSHPDLAETISRQVFPIDGLVRDALDAENLRMEEATATDLTILLQRLERSISYARDAINQLATKTRDAS